MFLLLVRILPALPLDASQPGSGFTISCGVSPVPPLLSRWIVAGPTTPSSHTRQTARIEDRTCRTRDEMQAPVGGNWPEACAPAQGGRGIHSGGCRVSTNDWACC